MGEEVLKVLVCVCLMCCAVGVMAYTWKLINELAEALHQITIKKDDD